MTAQEAIILTGTAMIVAAVLMTLGPWTPRRNRIYWMLMILGVVLMFTPALGGHR